MQHQAKQLENVLGQFDQVVVAFSGGVDSSVIAAAAHRACREKGIAVTADSESVPQWQLQLAESIAGEIGIAHQIIRTNEVDRPEYQRNDVQRCFFCKETLYEAIQQIAAKYPGSTIASGTNADDLGDHRPGIDAGRRSSVLTPLADLGISKAEVRQLAKHYGLSNHALPASPCLASRIAYGTKVTAERLNRIEQAEDYLRSFGFEQYRVRLHGSNTDGSNTDGESAGGHDLARIEVPKDELEKLVLADADGALSKYFRQLGFKFVSVDLAGFRSGSMNRVLVNIEPGFTSGDEVDRNEEARG